MVRIEEITHKKDWEQFLERKENVFFPFFQSWNWGEIQKKLNTSILRLGVYDIDNNNLVGICLIIEVKAKRGHYFHLRHGPVLNEFKSQHFDPLLLYIKNLAKQKKVSFIRLSPLLKKDDILPDFFRKRGFISSPIPNMDAEVCWVLDISSSEEELLKNMRKTHRYLIKKAQKMNIKIIQTQKVSDVDQFINMYKELAQKKQFVPHKGIKEEFEVLTRDNQAILLFAKYDEKIIAGMLLVFMGKMSIYHHAASLSEYRHIPASYLLQWEAILLAKRRGIKLHNFWGVVGENQKKHPWYGHTLFKMGFGGYREEFIHAMDLPLQIGYIKNFLIEQLTKKLKRY